MTTTQRSAATEGYSVIGSRPVRHDGTDKVTGRAQYGADISLPGMLYGKVLRSPHAHARIKSIDTSKAEAMPGVHAVATAADLPQAGGRVLDLGEGAMINPKFLSNNCLAAEKALYKGHAIAAVAADSAHEAELALALIDVEYEVLTPVQDVLEAMRDDAPLVHERLANLNDPSVRPGGLLGEGDDGKVGNVPNRYFYEIGDLEAGFAAADVVIEREFRTKAVHQGYIEPHAATALWNADDSLHLWCSSQGHFNVRDQTSTILGIPVSKVLVTQLEIGGGFGGKTLVYLEPVAAVLSKKTGRPVKIQMSRTEVFEGTGPTSGGYLRVKMGATNDGKITAADVSLYYEAGAVPRLAGESGSPVRPVLLQHRERQNRGCRRGAEPPQDRRLPRSRLAGRGLRRRVRRGRDLRCHRHGQDGLPHAERRQAGRPPRHRPAVRQHRLAGNRPGRPRARPLERAH